MARVRQMALLLAASVTLSIAACDGDASEKNDYVGEVNEITGTLSDELSRVRTELTAIGAPDKVSRKLTAFAGKAASLADKIAAITPPDEVADLQDQLVEQIRTLGDEATNAADEIRNGGEASVIGAGQQFVSDAVRVSGQVDSTLSDINAELQE